MYGSEREADKELTTLQHEANTGRHGGTMSSVATVMERWWEIHRHRLSPTTAQRYRQIMDQYLLPRWGDRRINALDVSEVSMWFQSLQHQPAGKRARPLAPASVHQIRAVFRRAMKAAVQWGWPDLNPLDRTETVQVRKPRMEADDPETIIGLVEAAWKKDPDLAV